jgi:hypothetical protein
VSLSGLQRRNGVGLPVSRVIIPLCHSNAFDLVRDEEQRMFLAMTRGLASTDMRPYLSFTRQTGNDRQTFTQCSDDFYTRCMGSVSLTGWLVSSRTYISSSKTLWFGGEYSQPVALVLSHSCCCISRTCCFICLPTLLARYWKRSCHVQSVFICTPKNFPCFQLENAATLWPSPTGSLEIDLSVDLSPILVGCL